MSNDNRNAAMTPLLKLAHKFNCFYLSGSSPNIRFVCEKAALFRSGAVVLVY